MNVDGLQIECTAWEHGRGTKKKIFSVFLPRGDDEEANKLNFSLTRTLYIHLVY